jgi:DNA-binding transcriptional LysR family regulator
MDFDERQLKAFVAIAETGALGRAARVANLTQPSLSRLIQGMELRLGHRLFDRESRGLVLTPAGELLLDHARLLLFEMETARAELDALSGLRRGTVRIGGVASVMRTVVARVLGLLLTQAPQLRVETYEAVDSELREALLQRRVDLVITADMLDDPGIRLLGRVDHQDSFAVFCSAANSLPDEPSLEELALSGWVMPGEDATPRQLFETVLRQHGFGPGHVPVETASVEMMVAVASASDLLCWLPEPLVAAHLADGRLRKLKSPLFDRHRAFYLHRRSSGILPDAPQRFVDIFPLA